MARSATNKAKAKAKKTAPKAPRLRAQIITLAKLTGITTGAGESSGYGNPAGTAMVITLKIPMGAPANVPTWDDYNKQDWRRAGWVSSELEKLDPKQKAVKAKKGDAVKVEPVAEAVGKSIDRAAEKKRLEQQYDTAQREKYGRECAKANAANARFMERAASFAMFAALRGQEVQLTLSPVQQGFKELFGNVTQAQLGSGTPDEDQPDFDDYGDDEDDEG